MTPDQVRRFIETRARMFKLAGEVSEEMCTYLWAPTLEPFAKDVVWEALLAAAKRSHNTSYAPSLQDIETAAHEVLDARHKAEVAARRAAQDHEQAEAWRKQSAMDKHGLPSGKSAIGDALLGAAERSGQLDDPWVMGWLRCIYTYMDGPTYAGCRFAEAARYCERMAQEYPADADDWRRWSIEFTECQRRQEQPVDYVPGVLTNRAVPLMAGSALNDYAQGYTREPGDESDIDPEED